MAKWDIVIGNVPTVEHCSNFSSIAGNKGNSELWAVKVNDTNDKAVLYYFKNLASGSYTQCMVDNVFGHAGGISCSSSYLFIGCRIPGITNKNKYVARIKLDTARKLPKTVDKSYFTSKGYLVDSSNMVGTLSYYEPNKLLVRDLAYVTNGKLNSDGYDKFYVMDYTGGSSPEYTPASNSAFYTYIPSNYRDKIEHNQGFFYDKSAGYLYTIYNLENGGNEPVDNRIFVYSLEEKSGTKDGLPYYKKMHTITINPEGKPDNVDYTKLEIESACLDKDGRLLLGGNFGRANGNYDDMIIRVKGFDPANPTPN